MIKVYMLLLIFFSPSVFSEDKVTINGAREKGRNGIEYGRVCGVDEKKYRRPKKKVAISAGHHEICLSFTFANMTSETIEWLRPWRKKITYDFLSGETYQIHFEKLGTKRSITKGIEYWLTDSSGAIVVSTSKTHNQAKQAGTH